MSIGCGTLASPSGFRKGTLAASRSNGNQHTLPVSPVHSRDAFLTSEEIDTHWAKQTRGPTRMWGTVKSTRFGGEQRIDGEPEQWLTGEYWNCDSNIRKWGEHEVRRNAAGQAHDIHRHDQITRVMLPPQPYAKERPPRYSTSGVCTADTCFLEAWGFDLGLRDRQANPAPLWKPVTSNEHFRSERSWNRNIGRLTDNFRSMRQTMSSPGLTLPSETVTLRPEDIGGETGELAHADDSNLERQGRTHGSRSCKYWDRYNHTVKREGAKMSCGIHSPSFKTHPEEYPYVDQLELRPSAVYTRRYRKWGESNLRNHVSAATRVEGQSGNTMRRA